MSGDLNNDNYIDLKDINIILNDWMIPQLDLIAVILILALQRLNRSLAFLVEYQITKQADQPTASPIDLQSPREQPKKKTALYISFQRQLNVEWESTKRPPLPI